MNTEATNAQVGHYQICAKLYSIVSVVYFLTEPRTGACTRVKFLS